jgi:hypothetical protein
MLSRDQGLTSGRHEYAMFNAYSAKPSNNSDACGAKQNMQPAV